MILNVIISIFIAPLLLVNNYNFDNYIVLVEDSTKDAPQKIYSNVIDVKTTAKSFLAIDVKSGKILYEKNSEEITSIASITKLMTALVFLEHNPGWQKEIYTIASDRKNGGIIHLNTGEALTIRNLFRTALIASDNDATAALARSTGLSYQSFVNEMNTRAKELGLESTHFFDPTGLHNNNKSTAQDIAKLLNHALTKQDIQKATSTSYYEFEVKNKEKIRTVKLKNTNRLTNSYLDLIGGKTGYIEAAGHCLAVKIQGEADQELIIIALGSQSNFDRFQDVKAIIDWVFTNYKWTMGN